MNPPATPKNYKSPQRKLVRFFEQSRNNWKAKSQAAKVKVKRLQNRVRFLEEGKTELKDRLQALETEVAQLKAQVQAGEQALVSLQKKGVSKPRPRA